MEITNNKKFQSQSIISKHGPQLNRYIENPHTHYYLMPFPY